MERESTRVEAFSDGVFAIAITLLVLDLKVPHVAGATALAAALRDLWPSYLAFLLSFATILVMWMNHHGLLLWVHRVDGGILAWNGVVLLVVTLVPFPTALLAEYLNDPGQQLAMAVYAATFLAILAAFTGLWWSISRRRPLVAPTLPDHEVRMTDRHILLGFVGYTLAIAASAFDALAGLVLVLAITTLFVANATRRHRLEVA